MTQSSLPLSLATFCKIEDFYHSSNFSSPLIFDYLGKNLEIWLDKLLSGLNVKSNSPLILGQVHPGAYIEGKVFIDKDVTVEPTAFIKGPAVILRGSEVRHGAYLRGNVFVGSKCVVGHTTEIKSSVFCDEAKAGHFAYVGDSFLGRNVNLGAGTKLANLKLAHDEVCYKDPESGARIQSGLKKFGAILGDHVQTGCNAVLSPGTLLLPRTAVMSCEHYHGTLVKGIYRGKR